MAPDARPFLFQLPFLRIIVMGGPFWVALFFVLSGYVCSMKSLRLARAGEIDAARKAVSNSIFRRVVRLVFPATLMTIISWSCTQMGAYGKARTITTGSWFGETPEYIEGFIPPIRSLFWNCVCVMHLISG